jgi:hypothetical protein
MAAFSPLQQQNPLSGQNPLAGQNALAAALTLAAKQKQQASQAASALARKSHPQTLGQPPQRQSNPAPSTPQVQSQAQPPPAQPQPAVVAAAKPPVGNPGAITPSGAANPVRDQLAALQGQYRQAQTDQSDALASLKSAMAQPQPTMPTYNQPTMQQANPGLALGAALAALFMPRYAQGPIGAIGVDQANRQKQFDDATTAAKDKWTSSLDTYENEAKRRQEAIENAEKLNTADETRLNRLDTAIDTETNREELSRETAARLAEQKRNHDMIQGRAMENAAMRRQFHNDLITHYGQELGLREEQINVLRGRLALGADNLRWQMKRFGMSEEDAAKTNGMRMATALVIERNREDSADTRQQNSAAYRAVLQGQHDFNALQQALIRNPSATTAQNLANFYGSPQGQKLNTALRQFGVSGDMAADILDQETGTDTGGAVPESSQPSAAAPEGTVTNNFFGGASPTGIPSVGGTGGAPKSVQDMLNEANAIAPGITGSIRGERGPAGGGAQGSANPQPPQNGAIDKTALAHNMASYQAALDYYHDPMKAWGAIRQTVVNNIQSAGQNPDPRVIEAYRQAVMRGSRQPGNVRPRPVPQPVRGNPLAPNPVAGPSPAPLQP